MSIRSKDISLTSRDQVFTEFFDFFTKRTNIGTSGDLRQAPFFQHLIKQVRFSHDLGISFRVNNHWRNSPLLKVKNHLVSVMRYIIVWKFQHHILSTLISE